MKTSYAAIIALSLSTLAASYANAEYAITNYNTASTATVPGKTRAQVLAELAEAQRTGDDEQWQQRQETQRTAP